MKKLLKKVIAVAMTFAMIGTVTPITKTVNPLTDSAVTVHAVSRAQCTNHGQYTTERSYCIYSEFIPRWGGLWEDYHSVWRYEIRCASCGTLIKSYTKDYWF